MRAALLLLSLAACGQPEAPKAAEPKFAEISFDELKAAVEAKKAVVIDVNGTDSFQQGHVPGAIDFEAHKLDLATLLPQDKGALLVAYCGGPQCSAWEEGAEVASNLGYKQVKHFRGGIKGWKESNGPIEL
ncbi:MAG TPA: rhodanese-like domain-containing protein [Myxococcota bacterium]|nr:rhodanese-like domain-containing protein [Myxococcota bacterium]